MEMAVRRETVLCRWNAKNRGAPIYFTGNESDGSLWLRSWQPTQGGGQGIPHRATDQPTEHPAARTHCSLRLWLSGPPRTPVSTPHRRQHSWITAIIVAGDPLKTHILADKLLGPKYCSPLHRISKELHSLRETSRSKTLYFWRRLHVVQFPLSTLSWSRCLLY